MEEFLVIAASCRPIVRSITQAGYQCRGIDLFADWDTARLCDVARVSGWPAAFDKAANGPSGMQLVWGGGLDNALHQNIALGNRGQLFAEQRCCAITGSALTRCRDPFFVADCLQRSGLPSLALSHQKPEQGQWVQKPIYSGGGERVRLHEASFDAPLGDDMAESGESIFYQEFKPGEVYGATFIADKQHCGLVGVCEQFHRSAGDFRFLYSASIGPIQISESLTGKISRMGEIVASACGLRGWFGIDFILNQDQAWLIEVNPRYTASMEILERAGGCSLFHRHLAAFKSDACDASRAACDFDGGMLGKQYVFWKQRQPLRISLELQRQLIDFGESDGFVTDIPQLGTRIEPDAPLCTVWASAVDRDGVRRQLKNSEDAILQMAQQKNAL